MDSLSLVTLLKVSELSPEDLGELIGVSGMTIRRWTEKPSHEALPEIYQNAIRESVFKLVIEGRIDSESRFVQKIFAAPGSLSQQAALKALGFPQNLSEKLSGKLNSKLSGEWQDHQETIMAGLNHIGAMPSRRERVESERKRLPTYKKISREWNERLCILNKIISSKKMATIDKFPAYGALFYLFMTFDLIPDTIPVFGLVDDFAILGMAVAYYSSRKLKRIE